MTDSITTRIAALNAEDQKMLTDITERALAALEDQAGAVILLCDVKGVGVAELLAAGNPLLIEPLLMGAGVVAQRLFAQPEGLPQ